MTAVYASWFDMIALRSCGVLILLAKTLSDSEDFWLVSHVIKKSNQSLKQ